MSEYVYYANVFLGERHNSVKKKRCVEHPVYSNNKNISGSNQWKQIEVKQNSKEMRPTYEQRGKTNTRAKKATHFSESTE